VSGAALTTGMEEYYDLRAEEYDDFYTGERLYAERDRPGWFDDRAALESWIASLAPTSVLDVACGSGFLTQHLRGEVTALDQSPRMLDVTRRRVPGAQLVCASAFALPFADKSFERLFTGHFYGHLRPRQRTAFLRESVRVADEVVVVDAAQRPEFPAEGIQHRPLLDGSTHEVYKRWFTGAGLAAELGGGTVAFESGWFVGVSVPAGDIDVSE
jgi:ubiquinone/menaquinone biosynthesis C-methylase UbiE